MLFNIFINDLIAKINFSEFLLFADDLIIFHVIESAEDCRLLQSDIDPLQKCCIETYIKKINIFKRNIIRFTRKTNNIYFNYFVGDILVYELIVQKILGLCLIGNCIFIVMLITYFLS
jgi:hypothetical protein